MTYLIPQLPAAAGSVITIDTETDMAGISFASFGMPVGGKGFRIDFWDLNMSNNGQRPLLRFVDGGGLKGTGYNSRSFRKSHTAAYARGNVQGPSDINIDPSTQISNLGLVQGFYEGHLMDAVQDIWITHGRFRDDTVNVNEVEVFSDANLNGVMQTLFISSGNGANWTAGGMSFQVWT